MAETTGNRARETVQFVKDDTAERVLAFLRRADAQFLPPLSGSLVVSDYAAKLAARANNVFAVVGDVDIAHAAYYLSDSRRSEAYLSSLCVLAAERGRGIGQVLLRGLIADARRAGLSGVALEVHRANEAAVALYRQAGFRTPTHAGEGAMMRMFLPLATPPGNPEADCTRS